MKNNNLIGSFFGKRETMKRLFIFFLAVVFLLNLSGCHRQDLFSSVTPTDRAANTEAETVLVTAETKAPEVTKQEPAEETASQTTEPSIQQSAIFPEPEDEAFVRVTDFIPAIRQALAYATVNNFTGYRIYDFTDAYLRYGTVKKLIWVCEELGQQGIGLIIWDGFRPVSAQAKLWEICPDPAFVSNPTTGKRSHCRGNTVDVTLYDMETGEELPMPTGFDNFTAYADRDYGDCSPEAAANARLLEKTMEKHGFKPYFAEWWHFTDTEDYPVDEFFDPAIPAEWSANCNEYISLRDAPGGNRTAKILKGETMQLHSWDGKYAAVSYAGRTGYVLTDYIMPADDTYLTECLDTVVPTNAYSYEKMLSDLETLENRYPDVVTVASIGTSELGRDIPVIRIGDLNARYHVLLQGAIHGREHLTAWLLTAMADYWLDYGIGDYGDVCYHIIPMTNPDGVVISQTGTLTEAQHQIYLSDQKNGYTSESESAYAEMWKANGEGVDINRNFPAGWEYLDGRAGPSSQQYPGTTPFSCSEAAALRDYTLRYAFDVTISYHASGSLIYYAYGDKEPVNSESKSLAEAFKEVTGYALGDSSGVDGAGYKDWVMDKLQIPSLTIEIGCGDAPLAEREIYSAFVRNCRVLPAVARWLQMR